jgi:hypothetical protein
VAVRAPAAHLTESPRSGSGRDGPGLTLQHGHLERLQNLVDLDPLLKMLAVVAGPSV